MTIGYRSPTELVNVYVSTDNSTGHGSKPAHAAAVGQLLPRTADAADLLMGASAAAVADGQDACLIERSFLHGPR
jgi:hypothetical protein